MITVLQAPYTKVSLSMLHSAPQDFRHSLADPYQCLNAPTASAVSMLCSSTPRALRRDMVMHGEFHDVVLLVNGESGYSSKPVLW